MHVTFSQSQNRRNIWISIAIDDVYEHACMHTYTSAQVTREEGILLSCCQASCISILPGPRRRRHVSCVLVFLSGGKRKIERHISKGRQTMHISIEYIRSYLPIPTCLGTEKVLERKKKKGDWKRRRKMKLDTNLLGTNMEKRRTFQMTSSSPLFFQRQRQEKWSQEEKKKLCLVIFFSLVFETKPLACLTSALN